MSSSSLPDPQQQLWRRYAQAEQAGLRAQALSLLAEFIDSIDDLSEDELGEWVVSAARELPSSGGMPPPPVPLRAPLWKSVVFPTLVALVRGGDRAAALLIVDHWQLVLTTPGCLAELPDELSSDVLLLEFDLLGRVERAVVFALRQDPTDSRARWLLITRLGDRLGHALHELPSGVIWGMNGATPEQCRELEAILDQFEELVALDGRTGEFSDFMSSCRFHFRSYAAYRSESDRQRSYADFLADGG